MTDDFELRRKLLRAAFATPESALPAWHKWRSASGWQDHLDFDSFLLLPRVYHNLGGQSVDDALFRLLKGVVKRNWLANSSRLATAEAVHQKLQEKGIRACLLPPVSLVVNQRALALTKKAIISFRILPQEALNSVSTLTATGWIPAEHKLPRWFRGRYLANREKITLQHEKAGCLELRWQGGVQNYGTDAAKLSANGSRICCLGPEDEIRFLLLEPGLGSPLRRLVYALLLLEKAPDKRSGSILIELLENNANPFLEELRNLFSWDEDKLISARNQEDRNHSIKLTGLASQ